MQALHFAARSGFASTCELLVRSGAALESGAAKNQATPLLLAVEGIVIFHIDPHRRQKCEPCSLHSWSCWSRIGPFAGNRHNIDVLWRDATLRFSADLCGSLARTSGLHLLGLRLESNELPPLKNASRFSQIGKVGIREA
jgi:hypothetical protein